jgi:integration host factor subunit beta
MLRSEQISNLADKHPQLTASDVQLVATTLIDSIVNQLVQGGRVEIRGFGAFSTPIKPARLGHNPKTGEIVDVPEKRAVHFKPGNELRERVNVEHEHEFLNVKVFREK